MSIKKLIAFLLVAASALVAASLAAPFGRPILAHDSFVFYEAATLLERGDGLVSFGEFPERELVPLTMWAPAYPVVLFVVHKFASVTLDQAASIVNYAAILATILLFYILAVKRTGTALAALLAVILAFEHPVQFAGAYALSEGLFLPLPLLVIYFCEKHFDSGLLRHAMLAGFAAGLCGLTRHAGAVFSILAPAAILIFSRQPARQRLLAIAGCGLVQALMLVPMWVRNYQITGALSGSQRGGAGYWSRIPADIESFATLLTKLSFASDAVVEAFLFWPAVFLSIYAAVRLLARKPGIATDRLFLVPLFFAAGHFLFFLFARINQNEIEPAGVRLLNILWPLSFLVGARILGVVATLRNEQLVWTAVILALTLRIVSNEEVLRHSHRNAQQQAGPFYMLAYGTTLNNFRPESPKSRELLSALGDVKDYPVIFTDARPHVIQGLTGIRTYRWSAHSACQQLSAAGTRGLIFLESPLLAQQARACVGSHPGWRLKLVHQQSERRAVPGA